MGGGLLLPDEGRISIAGNDLLKKPNLCKQLTGYIPDRPFLYEKLTGTEYLRFIASLYSENDILMEMDDTGVVKKRYTNGLYGTGPVGMKDQLDQKVYFMRDPLLSVTELTDSSGNVTASFRYYAFGSIRSASSIDDMGVSHRFNGKEMGSYDRNQCKG